MIVIDDYYYSCIIIIIIIIKLLCQQQNPRSEYDWLLTALIYGLIDCFRSILSDFTCPITNICNRTCQIRQLSSQ